MSSRRAGFGNAWAVSNRRTGFGDAGAGGCDTARSGRSLSAHAC